MGRLKKNRSGRSRLSDIVPAPLHRATNIYLTDTALPPPEPTPADAQAQEQLRTLRAKIESHEAAEQDMQRQIAELEKHSCEMMEELAELRAKESKPNTKNSNSSLSDERS